MKISKILVNNYLNLFKSFLTYTTFFTTGCTMALLGSSLLDLQILADVKFTKISQLVTLKSCGQIVGTLIASVLNEKFEASFILSMSNLITGVFLGLGPILVKFEFMATCFFIVGTSLGVADVLCNLWLTQIWKDKCANFLQMLHMSGGIGALTTPVITRIFLLPNEDLIESEIDIDFEFINSSYSSEDVIVKYAFLSIASIPILTSIPLMIIYIFKDRKTLSSPDQSNQQPKDQIEARSPSKLKTYVAVLMVAGINHAVISLEGIIGSLVTPFSVRSDLHMDKKLSVLVATVFWSCFSFTRLIYIPLTFIIGEAKLQIIALIISLCGIFVTVPWALYDETCMWIGFTLIGVGISPIFASSYVYCKNALRASIHQTATQDTLGTFVESHDRF
ncbi:major facilitator superfamily domain-containing protein 4A-like isoform X2 [Panonychus citri]|uniref:major facilitator superfamily domain-containing protein 4A-like isoform X2 n=1 Tax=Panonychus citri TaxID=50023 RepID=UPI002307C68F|nr:major facilitator superfamily domain-containing protein 4A-like isoform X2 [Panonychus citri]